MEEEKVWYTFNTGLKEPPAQQVHRRWFCSSFSRPSGLLSRLLDWTAPCVRDLPQWWTCLFFREEHTQRSFFDRFPSLFSSLFSFPILLSRSRIENRRVRSWRLRRSLRSLGNEPLFPRRIDRDICSIR